MPRGKRARDSAIVPFSTTVKSRLCSALIVADRHDARDVRRAAQILAARIDQQQAVAFDHRMRRFGRAVMRHRAVGVEARDRRETQRDETRPARARRRQLLVDGQFRDALAAERIFEPREEFGERGAVLFHRRADVLRFRRGLARFGERRRIHRLDDRHRRRHFLQQAERDAARVDQERRARGQRRERIRARAAYGATRTLSRASDSTSAAGTLPSATKSVASSRPISACATNTGL